MIVSPVKHINNIKDNNKRFTKKNKSNSSVAKPYKHIKHLV
jgi:hypothetical protein